MTFFGVPICLEMADMSNFGQHSAMFQWSVCSVTMQWEFVRTILSAIISSGFLKILVTVVLRGVCSVLYCRVQSASLLISSSDCFLDLLSKIISED